MHRRLIGLLAVLAVLAGSSGCGLFGGGSSKKLTASFPRAIGVYVHSDVRVLGVKIGQVNKITPTGRTVRIEMSYDAKYKIPATAQAVLVAPSIVSDRYVQLTPVFRGGPLLADGAVLQPDRTQVPVELDKIYSSLDGLNQALGPDGANSKGALSDLLHVSALNLKGNGAALHDTLHGLSEAITTLSDNRTDLFGTITNLQQFTTVLAQNDSTVREFNGRLAAVAAQLNGERLDLATAVKQLSFALAEVATFVKKNKVDLTGNIKDLASVTSVLVKQKRALKEFIDVAPTALSNLQLAYNPASGTLDTRDNSAGLATPTSVLCGLVRAAGQPAACQTITDLLKKLPPPPGGPPSLPPGCPADPTKCLPPPGAGGAQPGTAGHARVPSSLTLSGLLEASS